MFHSGLHLFAHLPPGKHDKKPIFIDIDGGDSEFLSIAMGLLDNFLLAHPQLSVELLNTFLTHHFSLFEEQRPEIPDAMSSVLQMHQLIKQMSRQMVVLVKTMAFTLRQLAVDEMCRHPSQYRSAFVKNHDYISPDMMRCPGTWIGESAFAALSKVLKMPVEVRVIEPGKRLPKCLRYSAFEENTPSNPSVVVRLEGFHCAPRIMLVERFEQTALLLQKMPDGKRIEHLGPSLEDIIAKIAEDDKRMMKVFIQVYNRLSAMVNATELNANDLLASYVTVMPHGEHLTSRVKYVCLEQGNQRFFDVIMWGQREAHHDILPINDKAVDKQMAAELIGALARAISLNILQIDDLFDYFEEKRDNKETSVRIF